MVDPTIIQSFQSTSTEAPKTTARLMQAYNRKLQTYSQAAHDHAATLVPLPFTTSGAFHGKFNSFLKDMAQTAAATQTIDPTKTKHFATYWRTTVLFSIARATANLCW